MIHSHESSAHTGTHACSQGRRLRPIFIVCLFCTCLFSLSMKRERTMERPFVRSRRGWLSGPITVRSCRKRGRRGVSSRAASRVAAPRRHPCARQQACEHTRTPLFARELARLRTFVCLPTSLPLRTYPSVPHTRLLTTFPRLSQVVAANLVPAPPPPPPQATAARPPSLHLPPPAARPVAPLPTMTMLTLLS